jgi:NADPH-dependent curcumin reductase CurA
MTTAIDADTTLPSFNREVRLAASPPPGTLASTDFEIVETPLTEPAADSVLVRNRYFMVFPGLRTLMDEPIDGVPLPALRPGDTLFGPAIGEVAAAPKGHALRLGDSVMHMMGWRDYAVLPAADCKLLDDALPDPVAYLAQGSAAYGAITRYAAIREGDTVFVSGAAGAVGTLAGQIARLFGAGRVIGSTGSPDKAERLVSELGYDQVVLRGTGSFDAQLAEAAPEGVDVVIDTVGGEQLVAALGLAKQGARVVLVGALSGQLAARRTGGVAPVELDTFHLVVKGISLFGYAGADHPDVEAEWIKRFGGWLRSGEVRFPHTLIEGLDHAPQALPDLIGGRCFGGAIVKV